MDRRAALGVAASCMVHAACAWFALRPASSDPHTDARDAAPIEVELWSEPPSAQAPEEEAPVSPEPEPTPQPAEPPAITPATGATKPQSERPAQPTAPRAPDAATPNPAPNPPLDANGGGWSLSPSHTSRIDLFPAPNLAGAAAPPAGARERPRPAEPAATAQASQTGGLREALAAADARRGMARGGSVVSAVHQVSHLAPPEGRLTVRVHLEPSGQPRAVQVVQRSGDGASWDSFVQALHAQLRRKPARALSDGARELQITVRVDASQVLPSGHAGAPVQAQGLGGTFDLSDVGAQARKRVQAHVLEERSVP